MKKCPKCGTENHDQAKFCANCGYKFQASQKPSNQNGIKCPHCGKINPNLSKFCRYCGTQLTETSDNNTQARSSGQPQMNYSRQQYRTQRQAPQPQPMAYASNYFTNYFNWFKGTLIHPLDQFSDNPYFGITSFGITAILLWVAEFLSTSNAKIFNELTNLFGYIPVNSYYSILAKDSFKSPLWLLIITLLTIAAYWLVDYICDLFTGHARTNPLFVANHLAGLTNFTTIASILVIFGALINSSVIVWLFILIIKLIFITGLFYTVKTSIKNNNSLHISKLYVAMMACLACFVIQGLVLLIIGDVLMM